MQEQESVIGSTKSSTSREGRIVSPGGATLSSKNWAEPRLNPRKLPRIICVGAEALTHSHGTGMMFGRHFSEYPRGKVVDIHTQNLGGDYLFPRVTIDRFPLTYSSWNEPNLRRINMQLHHGIRQKGGSLIYQDHYFAPFKVDWDKLGGPPDLIYSTCFSARDFAFLHHVYRHLPKKVPIIQHFLDLDLSRYNDLVSIYGELAPAMVAVWALTSPISYAVKKFEKRPVEMVQALQQPLSKSYKTEHRRFSRDFKPLIIGNIWSGSAFNTLRRMWSEAQKNLEFLPAIHWSGHPRRYHELKYLGVNVNPRDPAIRDIGFLSAGGLRQRMKGSDLAIVAFSGDTVDKEHYTTFSLPSRIGDYCAMGLPIVLISRKDTEPWRLVSENYMGITLDPADPNAVRTLGHFIFDKHWRAECGGNARKFAERELNLKKYQNSLYPKLIQFAKRPLPQDYLAVKFRN